MKSRVRPVLVGAWAALRVPLWLRRRPLNRLLKSGADANPAGVHSGDPAPALRTAERLLARLARLPRSPWRTTCLYRSVAECLVLRHYGVPARLRIGVRRAESGSDRIAAHAWVVRPGREDLSLCPPLAGARSYQPMRYGTAE